MVDGPHGHEPGMPHFNRGDGRYIDYEPPEELFDVLPNMDDEELRGLGLQPWDDEHKLWLFPVEWYEHIPEGLEIVSITWEEREFDPDRDIKEARYGAMPYGIVKPDRPYPEEYHERGEHIERVDDS